MLSRRSLALLLVAVLGGGCRRAAVPPEPEAAAAGPRIVVMAPMGAEIVAALGEEGRIVGVGDWVTWPPSLILLPKVGAYQAPNLEVVLELEPDLFVSTASQAASPAHARLRELGIEVVELDGDTVAGVYAGIATLGARLGRGEDAARLNAGIRERLAGVSRRVAGLSRPRVLIAVGADPLFVAAPGSMVDELLAIAGGANVVAEPGTPYRQVSFEVVLERLPEVIVDTSDNRPGAPRGRTAARWGAWPFLPAVRDERVFWVSPVRLVINGPRLPEMAELLGRLIHPEVFGEPTPDDFRAPSLP